MAGNEGKQEERCRILWMQRANVVLMDEAEKARDDGEVAE